MSAAVKVQFFGADGKVIVEATGPRCRLYRHAPQLADALSDFVQLMNAADAGLLKGAHGKHWKHAGVRARRLLALLRSDA